MVIQFSCSAQVLTSAFCAVEMPVTLRRTLALCMAELTVCCDCNNYEYAVINVNTGEQKLHCSVS